MNTILLTQVSGAAGALCVWVHAIYIYANVAKEVAPKRQRLKEASESLAIKQLALKDAQEALAIVTAKLAALQVSYDTSVNDKNRLREEAESLEAKLDRADKLVKGMWMLMWMCSMRGGSCVLQSFGCFHGHGVQCGHCHCAC